MKPTALGLMCALLAACAGTSPKRAAIFREVLPAALPADRRAADKIAKEVFPKLHFYSEGRGMALVPGLIGFYQATRWTGAYESLHYDQWGLIKDGRDPVGVIETGYKGMRVGSIGCSMCHIGRAAGRTIVGLGNKRFDLGELAHDFERPSRLYSRVVGGDAEQRAAQNAALDFLRRVNACKQGNLTQGTVPLALIWDWFYRVAGRESPANAPCAVIKVPAFWGYDEKRYAGQFCDGYGDGSEAGWAVLTELAAGQTPEGVRGYAHRLEPAESIIGALLPPPYPFAIDRKAAARGALVFEENCVECHGKYRLRDDGLPDFRAPKMVAIDTVRTDSARFDSVTRELNELVDRNPLSDIIKRNPERKGYFAPRLEGIWCRFPYLHNASVPSVAALLTPPAQRPVVFSMQDAGERHRFDEAQLGLTLPDEREHTRLMKRGADGDRSVYDTRREGQSNRGHEFGLDLSAAEKHDLIEYLKTL